MTEYWVSNAKYFCKYCKIFIADNKISRSTHENGLKHKDNLERYMRQIRKNEETKDKDAEKTRLLLQKIDRAAASSYIKDTGVTPPLLHSSDPATAPARGRPAPGARFDSVASSKKGEIIPYWATSSTSASTSFPSPAVTRTLAPSSSSPTSSSAYAAPSSSTSSLTFIVPTPLDASTGLGTWAAVEEEESMIPASRSKDDDDNEDEDEDDVYSDVVKKQEYGEDDKKPIKTEVGSSWRSSTGRGDSKPPSHDIKVDIKKERKNAPSAVDERLLEEDDGGEENLHEFKLREKRAHVALSDLEDGGGGTELGGVEAVEGAVPVFKKRRRRGG
ncbi:hypothetical protein DFJ73DRAFT_848699 [Zopfochytrium polystomum]|nr:hypothetical protein DFJ73DRAFT_848699 [Zopfochytrium polystomum]